MERVLKPDVKYGKENVFDDAQFYSSNHYFIHHLMKDYGSHLEYVLDIACGPGDIAVLLAKKKPSARITAVDCSAEMIKIAREAAEGLNIDVIHGRIPGAELGTFDTVISKDFFHYLPDPDVFWKEVSNFSRDNTAIYVLGFIRPDTEEDARDLVERIMPWEIDLLKEDFYTSLCAGFTLEEVEAQVADLGLEVVKTSQAHFLVKGHIRPYRKQSATFINKPRFQADKPEGDLSWN